MLWVLFLGLLRGDDLEQDRLFYGPSAILDTQFAIDPAIVCQFTGYNVPPVYARYAPPIYA